MTRTYKARSKQAHKKVQRFKIAKEPEVSVGTGKLLVDIRQKDTRSFADPNSVWSFQKGDTVHVARAMITGAGPSYRIMHTIVWLGPEQFEASQELQIKALEKVDNNDLARLWANSLRTGNSLTPSQKCVKVIKGEPESEKKNRKLGAKKAKSVSDGRSTDSKMSSFPKRKLPLSRSKTRSDRKSYMDKKELRNLICQLVPSNTLHITFTGAKAHLTSNYTVLKVRTGKGRGGSKILDLVDAFKNTISTGTKDNESILNITVGGAMHGHATEAEAPSNYPKNRVEGEKLRKKFASMLDAEGDYTIRIESPMPSLDGTWTVNKAAKVQGRIGQVKLSIENVSDGRKTELWSYRHSGAISKLEILGDDGLAVEPAVDDDNETLNGSEEESPDQFADKDSDLLEE